MYVFLALIVRIIPDKTNNKKYNEKHKSSIETKQTIMHKKNTNASYLRGNDEMHANSMEFVYKYYATEYDPQFSNS